MSRVISGKIFLYRSAFGLVALLVATVAFGVILGIASCVHCENVRIQHEDNKSVLRHYHEEADGKLLSNAVIRSWHARGTADVEFPQDSKGIERYLELVIRVTDSGASKERRIAAYVDYLQVKELPENVPLGLYQALQDDDISPSLRHLRLSRLMAPSKESTLERMAVDGMVVSLLAGEKLEIVPVDNSPTIKPVDESRRWKAWSIFALVLFCISQAVMLSFFFARVPYKVNENFLVVSYHPLTWLILAAFAPIFVPAWIGFGLYRSVSVFGIGLAGFIGKVRHWLSAAAEKRAQQKLTVADSKCDLRSEIITKKKELEALEFRYSSLSHPHRDPPPSLEMDFRRMERDADDAVGKQ